MNCILKIITFTAALSLFAMPVVAADMPVFDLIIKNHRFEPSTITIPVDTKVRLNVKNADAEAEEFESADLSREKIIAGNSQSTIIIGPLTAGTYAFVGEYHAETAKGQIIVK